MVVKGFLVRGFLALMAALIVAAGPLAGIAPVAWAASTPVARFDWTMDPRFPTDTDGDGLINLPNSWAYANPDYYDLSFDACASSQAGGAISTYKWRVEGSALPAARELTTSACKVRNVQPTQLPQGDYTVTLTVTASDGQTGTMTAKVKVKDYLIVAVGDSVSAGEGNPDINGDYRYDNGHPALWMDERCHRSSKAGVMQAARQFEDADPRSSVTFIFLSCSGATINHGMLGGWAGQVPPPGAPDLDPQIVQAARIAQGRQVDALVMSIGGNDINFEPIVRECVWNGDCPNHQEFPWGPRLYERVNTWLKELRDRWTDGWVWYEPLYSNLDYAIDNWGMNAANVFITQYPNPFRTDSTAVCPSMVNDIQWPGEVDNAEATWAQNSVLAPLNSAVQGTQSKYGWRPITGIAQAFEGVSGDPQKPGHGYCASQHWIRTAAESVLTQGPFNDRAGTKGTLHPNESGQDVYRDRIFDALLGILPGYTKAGNSVQVQVNDTLKITFSTVSKAGMTRGTAVIGGMPAPAGYRAGSRATQYLVTTTAVHSGPTTACINYSGETFLNEANIRLFHEEGGVWVDHTSTRNLTTKTVCGVVYTSLTSPAPPSSFALFEPGS